jgi:hypothetical protein
MDGWAANRLRGRRGHRLRHPGDQIPKTATESLIAWLATEHGTLWLARKLWGSQPDNPIASTARQELAVFLETSLINAAPEHRGDVYGHLLADAIAGMDWEAVAGSLLSRVEARAAA